MRGGTLGLNLAEGSRLSRLVHNLSFIYGKMLLHPSYRYVLFILGLPINLVVFLIWRSNRKNDGWVAARQTAEQELLASSYRNKLKLEVEDQLRRKHRFFQQQVSEEEFTRQTEEWLEETVQKELKERTSRILQEQGNHRLTMADTFRSLFENRGFSRYRLFPAV